MPLVGPASLDVAVGVVAGSVFGAGGAVVSAEGVVLPGPPSGSSVFATGAGSGFGGAQVVARNPETGVYSGASESRKDGCALGY
ncbi:MAG: hypothetical protein IH804_09960 [Planctomycetes bacterium]|nr:hypothetical protein [Planctomycetota bacterium]